MRLIFAGTPAFSVAALDALVDVGHEIVGVYTQPDRPAGRGQKIQSSAVSQRAVELGLPLFKPVKLRGNDEALAQLRALRADAMVVVAYGLILPQAVLDISPLGCLNIHASLLPRWRGAAPIQRAILAGDAQTGVTIMRMDAGLDTGPMLLSEALPLSPLTTAGELHDLLAPLGARLVVEALDRLAAGSLREQIQPEAGVTYAAKLSKEEAHLDWALPTEELLRRIHGYNPMPGAWNELLGERLKLLRAETLAQGPAPEQLPGTVIRLDQDGLLLTTGDGVLRITELQRPGAKAAKPLAAFGARALSGQRLT
ncbi:MAG: methionyl-tRNA formyltransferase [Panacagrimonas sp.]